MQGLPNNEYGRMPAKMPFAFQGSNHCNSLSRYRAIVVEKRKKKKTDKNGVLHHADVVPPRSVM